MAHLKILERRNQMMQEMVDRKNEEEERDKQTQQ